MRQSFLSTNHVTYSKSQNETIFLFEIDVQQLQISYFLLSPFHFHFEHSESYFQQVSYAWNINMRYKILLLSRKWTIRANMNG